MRFTVKKHNTSEVYDIMCSFWDMHKFPRVDLSYLPQNTFIVYLEEIPLYSMCFYFTDAKGLAWIGWQISNKNVPRKRRDGALAILLNHIENYAKKKGVKMLMTTSNTEPVVDVLLKAGFFEGDLNVNQYFKKL
jgi:hypothetical protein